MKTNSYVLTKYEADEGKVFDWADLSEHLHEEQKEDGTKEMVQDHLYAKILWIGHLDNINNYVEVDEPEVE